MNEIAQLNAALAGRYALEREVGAGGMATVFLARDLRHDRRVALKLLKPELGAMLGVERFLAEIKVTANLQHPNLLPLFDSGATEGLLFYVMPFVEGESLRRRIEREKQLPVDDAVRIAAAVAGALDYAHRHGVIHRDLKPENILLHDGQPMVADFGIALAVSNAAGGRITQTGLSLGTPQYMSPEQASGDRAIDGRTDIYSLGAVLYEMLTGEPPHVGSTSQAIIARVLTEKPRSIRASRPNVSLQLEAAVEHALEKLPADRFATAREFVDALTGKLVLTTHAAAAGGTLVGARGLRTPRERGLAIALAAVVALWAVTSVVIARRTSAIPEAPVVRFEIETPVSTGPLQIGISPDGRTVSFGAFVGGKSAIWARPLGATNAAPIRGTEGANTAFWSPDGRQIGFVVDGRLKRVAAEGGAPESICDASGTIRGASWNADNVIIFSKDGAIHRVATAIGVPKEVSLSAPGVSRWEQPWFLPDGDHFLVVARGGDAAARGVYVASLAGGTPMRIADAPTRVGFAPPEQLIFVRDLALYAQPFDTRAMRLTGDPVRIADDVGANVANGAAGFAVSNTGALVYRAAGSGGLARLQWFGRDGKPQATVGDSTRVQQLALSPDGKLIAISALANATSRVRDVFTVDVTTNITSRLTADLAGVGDVLWSPDSRAVTFRSAEKIRAKAVGGVTDSVVYATDGPANYAEIYSSDGRTLLFRRPDSLFALSLTGDRKATLLANIKGIDEVRFSPDGKHVSYGSNESGAWQIYVASYPSLDNRRQISANGGNQARWKRDGTELYFLAPDGKVMVAAARPSTQGEFLAPTLLFQSPLQTPSAVLDQWDVTRDGQRFLFPVSTDQQSGAGPLTVVLNWTSMLNRE